MKLIQLRDLVKIRTGKLDANASDINGIYPFFTCSKDELRINNYAFDCECVLIAGNGDLNVKFYQGKFNAYQRTYVIESLDNKILDNKYLYYFLDTYMQKLRYKSIGGVIKYIKLENLTEPQIPLPPIEEQKRIVEVLDKADELRRLDLQLFKKYVSFLQSVFLNLFGDPVTNPKGWEIQRLETLSHISSGVTKGRKLIDVETIEVPYLRVANVQAGRLDLTEIKTIEIKKTELEKYLVKKGD
ncbi:MAG: restriction endonuclease subunit S, partial [Chitinophagaceae bacterium]